VKPSLTKVIQWGHELLAEVVGAGDLAVDLTAGNGYDTLALLQMVGPTGQVVAFDIQTQALSATADKAKELAVPVRFHYDRDEPLTQAAGVDLVLLGHENFARVVNGTPKGIIANLGFLPGGAKEIITRPDSTLAALDQALQALAVGGRLAVVVYPGHPGGAEEAATVSEFLSGLGESSYQVLQVRVANRSQSPFLLVVEKRD